MDCKGRIVSLVQRAEPVTRLRVASALSSRRLRALHVTHALTGGEQQRRPTASAAPSQPPTSQSTSDPLGSTSTSTSNSNSTSTAATSTTISAAAVPAALASNEYLQSLEPGPAPASPAQDRQDARRLVGVCATVAALALVTELNKGWIGSHQEVAMTFVFLAGYLGIIVEESLGLSKAAVGLILAAALWSIRATAEGLEALDTEIGAALGEVSAVIFFLLGAMTVVEVVDSHQGFKVITQSVRPTSKSQLLVAVSALTFVMSSVLDNLTTTIVMVALLNKLCPDPETRRFLGAAVVVAANAGGAWTPIGDVTTTMLWIHGQISTGPTMRDLLLPSALSVGLPVAAWALTAPEMAGPRLDGGSSAGQTVVVQSADVSPPPSTSTTTSMMAAAAPLAAAGSAGPVATHGSLPPPQDGADAPPRSNLVLSVGLGSLLMVPVLRAWAGLPPHMGMLACLGFLWLVTDAIHFGEDRSHLTVSQALKRVDSEAVLFFTGVLLAVEALDKAGLLRELAEGLGRIVPRQELVAGVIGLASAVVDNVPLVAATMGMYDMQSYPQDSRLWQLIAYCAGTGGSLLIIGSAAGVAFMGIDRSATFGWYARRITPWAAAGYFAGLGAYLLQQGLTGAAAVAGAGGP